MYELRIDEAVLKEDFKGLSKADQKMILKAIEKKLAVSPDTFGKPLQHELKGYHRLRVGIYRVIYKIFHERGLVHVCLVDFRRDDQVYDEAKRMLGKRKS